MSSSPVIPIPGAPNLDNSSLASYATLSLSSGPLPLLSEEDMVLDSDVLSFTKDCIIPGFGNTAKETHCTIEKKTSSMKLLECLQDGGEKVKNGEGRGDRHLPLEEGQVFLPSKS